MRFADNHRVNDNTKKNVGYQVFKHVLSKSLISGLWTLKPNNLVRQCQPFLGGTYAIIPLSVLTAEPLPIFGPSVLWPNSWMHQDATWGGDRPQSRRLCVRWGPSPLPKKGSHFSQPPNFRPMSIVSIDTTWYGGRPQPRRHCVRWKPSSPPLKGHELPIFGQCPLWQNGWMD